MKLRTKRHCEPANDSVAGEAIPRITMRLPRPLRGLAMTVYGFTLVEFVLVIAISGIIFISLAQAVIITIRSFDIALAGSNLVGQTDVSFERMMREIRQMKNRTSLVTATSTDIRFIDINNNDIEYKLQTNQLMRNANAAIDNATAMTIEYFDKYGALIAIPTVSPQNTNVRTVRITLTVESSSQSITVRSLVRLRNLR